MDNKIANNELLLSSTSVPDIFIMQYIQTLSSDAIKLYLWLLMMYEKSGFSSSALDDYSFLNKKKNEDVLVELISAGLVYKKDDSYFLTDLKQKEAMDFAKSYAARGATLDGTELMADEEEHKLLAQSISNTFYLGKMQFWGYRLIDKCLYNYKMDSMVIYKLFEEGKANSTHIYPNKMETIAETWYNKGYVTPDKLDIYYKTKKDIDGIIELIGRITRKRVDGLAIERITKWVEVYNATPDLVEYALRQNEYRGATVLNAEDTLGKWFEAGIHTIDKAMVYENERHQENKSKIIKKKGTDNVWATGAEAGIVVSESADNKASDPNDGSVDDILDMFGD